jgi:TrmH family RNA methyltransferase
LRELSRAHDANCIFEIYFCRSKFSNHNESEEFLNNIINSEITVFEVSDNVYEKISLRENGDGFIGLGRMNYKTLSDVNLSATKPSSLFIALENIEKPNNFGAIVRTVDSSGANGVIILNNSIEVYNPNAIRNSQGAIFFVNIYHASTEEFLEFSSKNNLNIFVTTPHCDNIYFNEDFSSGCIFLMGSESHGVTDFWMNNNTCRKIKIPQLGKSDSLNVSVATAIVAYEAVRQQAKR